MEIRVGFSEGSLFGAEGSAGYAPFASANRFADMLVEQLVREYPEAEITFLFGSDDFHRVEVEGEDEAMAVVGDVVHTVWAGREWLVPEPESD